MRAIIDFNPKESIKKGNLARKIPMTCLDVFSRKINGSEEAIYSSGPKFRNGDTLLARITPCLENGKTAFVDILDEEEVAFGSTEFIILRAKPETDEDYLYYLARSPTFRKRAISCMEGTSGRKRVNDKALQVQALPVPGLSEQKAIGNILSSIDAKIDLNNRINAELESLARTIYDYWFLQFDFPDAEGRPYRSSGGEMRFDEELGRDLPEGWSSSKIGHILSSASKVERIRREDYDRSGNIPVVDQSKKYIAGYTDNYSSLIKAGNGKIVFGDHTRVVKFVNFDFARGADGTQIIFSEDKRLPSSLLYQAIDSIDLSNYGYARHFKFLKDIEIMLAEESLVKKYDDLVTPFWAKISAGIKENAELSALRDWLLPLLMSGEVRVEE